MKTNLKSLYEACQFAFASNDDGIMVSALRYFEAELRVPNDINQAVEQVKQLIKRAEDILLKTEKTIGRLNDHYVTGWKAGYVSGYKDSREEILGEP